MTKEIVYYNLLQELLKNNCKSPKGQVQTGPYPHARHRPVVTYNCNFNYDAVKKLILPLKKKINSNVRSMLTKKVRKKKRFPLAL